MKETTWYDLFVGLLCEKQQKNVQLTYELMKLLDLEHEAVYRRLKKIVPFPAHEIAKIASAWDISLDEIMSINLETIPFLMYWYSYLNPTTSEISCIQSRVGMLDNLCTAQQSEFLDISNTIPKPFIVGFPNLHRVLLFNWVYQYCSDRSFKYYSKVIIPNLISSEFDRYKESIRHIRNSSFILDEMVFEYFVTTVQYFHSIMRITDSEKELIKNELHDLLDYITEITNKGFYPETQQKVNIYISQINIDTNYSYLCTDKQETCHIHAFCMSEILSQDLRMIANFKKWMILKKRTSYQISEVNERSRFEYLAKQREIINML